VRQGVRQKRIAARPNVVMGSQGRIPYTEIDVVGHQTDYGRRSVARGRVQLGRTGDSGLGGANLGGVAVVVG
jgi:hypothetical protein